jgi:UDP-3-O-[3-hydroxymyristoyl] glucosamine N-acyltransferase
MAVSLAELVARFGGELVGDGARTIRQVAPLARAVSDEIAGWKIGLPWISALYS